MPTVRAAKMPGRINEYTVEDGATVNDVLAVADLGSTEGFEVRLNGASDIDPATRVSEGDTIIMVRKIKGN